MATDTTDVEEGSSLPSSLLARIVGVELSRTTLLWAALVVYVEVALVLLYVVTDPSVITNPLILVYPFVWIDLSIAAVVYVDRPSVSRRRLLGTGLLASVYFGVLMVAGGLVGLGHAFHGHSHGAASVRLAVSSVPPGWSPALLYGGDLLRVSLFPYKLVGYATLSYLVFVTLLDIDASVLSGALGLVSCVSCTWPILGTVLTALFGGGSVVTSLATNQPYGLSTLVFTTAVGLLVWRPFTDWTVLSWIRSHT
jgi:hypothetical protein